MCPRASYLCQVFQRCSAGFSLGHYSPLGKDLQSFLLLQRSTVSIRSASLALFPCKIGQWDLHRSTGHYNTQIFFFSRLYFNDKTKTPKNVSELGFLMEWLKSTEGLQLISCLSSQQPQALVLRTVREGELHWKLRLLPATGTRKTGETIVLWGIRIKTSLNALN